MKLTSDDYLVPRLRISASVPQIPQCAFMTCFIFHVRSRDLSSRATADISPYGWISLGISSHNGTASPAIFHYLSSSNREICNIFTKPEPCFVFYKHYLKWFDYFCENTFASFVFSPQATAQCHCQPTSSEHPVTAALLGDTVKETRVTTCRY